MVKKEADYVFSLKGNQEILHEEVKGYRDMPDFKSRLREQFPQWKTVNSIGMVESTRDNGDGAKTEWRYFVSSLNADEELFARTVRSHWGIYYMLDVVYREDACHNIINLSLKMKVLSCICIC
jgi:predicted transposase YbfD/YdcC